MQTIFGHLDVTFADGRTETFTLSKATVRVGRGSDANDINLGDDPRISRLHAQFLCSPGQISVLVLSPSGMIVNGERLPEKEAIKLTDGSTMEIGPVRLKIAIVDEPVRGPKASTQMADETLPESITSPFEPAGAQLTPPSPPAQIAPDILAGPIAPAPMAVPAAPAESAPPAALAPPAPPTPSLTDDEEHLDLRLANSRLIVAPGEQAVLSATVEKRSGEVDKIALTIDGIPASWYSITPDYVSLIPRHANQGYSRGDFTITLKPPRKYSSLAGDYPCRIIANSERRPDRPARQGLTVTVLPFYQLHAEIKPRRPRGRRSGRFQLAVTNLGNKTLPVMLDAEDQDESLSFELEREEIKLEPGRPEAVQVVASPIRWLWPFGRPVRYDLIGLLTPQPAEERDETAELPQGRPETVTSVLTLTRLPAWLQLLPLLLLFMIALIYLLFWYDDGRSASPLAIGPLTKTVSAQSVPHETLSLSFQRDGVIKEIPVKPNDPVHQGERLAELRYYEQLLALRKAEDGLERALADLDAARRQQQRDVRAAQLGLQQAQNDLARVSPGGADDPALQQQSNLTAAQRELNAAQRAATGVSAGASEAKLAAEDNLVKAAEAVQEAQQKYNQAYWANDWVEKYGTDPNVSPEITNTTGTVTTTVEVKPPKLNPVQRQAFKDALATAERAMHAAERALEAARRDLDRARADEISQNAAASETVNAAQSHVDTLVAASSLPNSQRDSARIDVDLAELKIETARESGLEPYIKAVEAAQDAVNDARAQLENRVIYAPTGGVILAVTMPVSTSVQAAAPVILMAAEGKFDLATNLPPELLARIDTTQTISVTLSDTPDLSGHAKFTGLSADASGGSSPNSLARFEPDADLQTRMKPGLSAQLTITLDERPDILEVHPPFLWVDGDRRYLLVRDQHCPWNLTGKGLLLRLCEHKVYVQPGVESDNWVEIRESYDKNYSMEQLRAAIKPDSPTLVVIAP